VLKRIPWQSLPASFREDVARRTQWASMPEPLAEGARVTGGAEAEEAKDD
jgi:hypothetical protein